MAYIFYHHDEIQLRNNKPTYRALFAKKQFAAIENFIGKNKADYKVVNIGIHPSIALYLVGSIQQLLLKIRFNCLPMSSEAPDIIVMGMFFSLQA